MRRATEVKKCLNILMIKIVVILFAVSGIHSKELSDRENTSPQENVAPTKTVSVDEIVRHPENYKGYVGVFGKVLKLDDSKLIFVLGCEDACIMMPVKYKGKMPKTESKVTVYGKIKKTESGKYLFDAQKIKSK